MSIQEHLNKIRNAIKGSEVRESIAKGIETVYDDASENGNANMEVKIARGQFPNLRTRLDEVDNKQQQTNAGLTIERQRIDNLNSLPDGSTTGDIHLSDIRIGADGVTYTTPASAVRANDRLLNDRINTINDVVIRNGSSFDFELGTLQAHGVISDTGNTTRIRTTDFIRVSKGTTIRLNDSDLKMTVFEYNNRSFIKNTGFVSGSHIVTSDVFIKIVLTYDDDREIPESEINEMTSHLVFEGILERVTRFKLLDERHLLINNGEHQTMTGSFLDWSVGSIDASEGIDLTDNPKRARTDDFLHFPYGGEIIANSNNPITFAVLVYDEYENFKRFDPRDYEHEKPFTVNPKESVKIIMKRINDNIDVREINVQKITEFAQDIEIIKYGSSLDMPVTGSSFDFELGTLQAHGVISDTGNTTRIRTTDFIETDQGLKVEFIGEPNLKYDVFIYDDSGIFIKSTGYRKKETYVRAGRKIKILLAYDDDREISQSGVVNLADNLSVTIYSDGSKQAKEEEHKHEYVVSGGFDGFYHASDTPFNFSNTTEMQVSDIYAEMDSLLNANPEYVSKQEMGRVEGGLELNYYTFTPEKRRFYTEGYSPSPDSAMLENPLPKIIISAGLHGDEKTSPVSVINLFKNITEKWQDDPNLEFMRHNIEFVVIPAASPLGLNNYSRGVLNVDPNSDFPRGNHVPVLEATTKLMDILNEHSDADLFIDYHNMVWQPEGTPAYAFVADETTTRVVGNSIVRTIREWQKRYSFFPQADATSLTYVVPAFAGTFAEHARKMGIPSAILEIPREYRYAPDSDMYSDFNIQLGEGLLVNSIASMMKMVKLIQV